MLDRNPSQPNSRSAAGREELHILRSEERAELDDALLVGHRDEGPRDGDHIGFRTFRRVCF